MPRISEFYGILIYMYFQDHGPPHFHAIYGESEAIIEIESAEILHGRLPRRAQRMVAEWAKLHEDELKADWQRAQQGIPLEPITPLD